MAHEWIMCVGQGNHKHNPAYSNWYALDAWVKEYGVLNGTALTDTITTDCFLEDFQLTFATLFSGVRHDSGDPLVWGEKMIKHYEKLGIDTKTKTLLFSDSLDFERADKICRHFSKKAALTENRLHIERKLCCERMACGGVSFYFREICAKKSFLFEEAVSGAD